VGFQWVVAARERGAKVIHVDPRFTRTSSVAEKPRTPVTMTLRCRISVVSFQVLPLALRLLSLAPKQKPSSRLRRLAAISAVTGALLIRISWIYAVHSCAKDWRSPLEIPHPQESEGGVPCHWLVVPNMAFKRPILSASSGHLFC
jgi:hypothetical protein